MAMPFCPLIILIERSIDLTFDRNDLTVKPISRENIGIVDLNFKELQNADFPLVEIFLRLWPGDAMKQLRKLNRKFIDEYPKYDTVTLKEFFSFIAILISAAPAGLVIEIRRSDRRRR